MKTLLKDSYFSLNTPSASVTGELIEKLKSKKSLGIGTTPLALILSACGSGSSTSSNVLSLTKAGDVYSASSVTGFTVNDTSTAKFDVSDSSSNAYEIKLDASGTGVLEFDFADANDTVTLSAGSKTTGFTTLKVTDGTVDATSADLSGITRVEVASGIKISLAQIKSIPTIVANSSTSKISVEVTTEAEATELVSLLSAGTVKVYGDNNPIKLVAAPAATVSAETLTAKETETVASVKSTSEAPADTSTTETTTTTSTTTGGSGTITTFSSANVDGGVTFGGNATGDITVSYNSNSKALEFSRATVNDASTPILSTVTSITMASSDTLSSTVADHNTITGTVTLAGGGTYKFSDTGTATGVAGVAEYKLADGTNDFTLAAGETQKVTGGTGADTITLTAGTHTIVAGTGTDILKVAQASSASTIADGAALDLSNTSQQTWSGSNKVTMSGVEDIDASGQLNTAVGLTLTGSTGANSLTGGSGNDTLIGGAGADTLNGGVGTGDVVSYSDVTAASAAQHGIADASIKGVAINLSASAVTGSTMNTALSGTVYLGGGADATSHGSDLAAGTAGYIVGAGNADGGGVRDTITNTEGAVGSARNDYIALGAGGMSATAGDGDDVVVGGAGDDTVIGGAGADTLNGAGGAGDILSYADITAASASQHGIADASIKGVAINVSGGALAGTTINSGFSATVYLGGGANSSSHGSDLVNGTVGYIVAAGDATGGNKIDTITNFESFVGSARNDFFALGNGGSLTVDGGAGADVIVNSGTGVDTLKGGAGNDVFVYASSATFIPASADDAVIDSIDGGDGTDDVIQIAGAIGIGAGGTDTLARVTNTEILKAAANADGSNDYAHAVTIKSDAALGSIRTLDFSADVDVNATTAVTLTGVTAGVTIKTAAAGASTIIGTSAIDTITGGALIDTITGGGGADIIDLASDSVIDKIVFSAAGDFGDVVSNFAIGTGSGKDDIELATALGDSSGALTFRTAVAHSTDEAGTLTALTTDAGTDGNYIVEFTGSTIDATLLDKIDVALAAGSAATGKTFILIDNGTHSALLYDADSSDADVDVQLVCLLSGVADITAGTDVVIA